MNKFPCLSLINVAFGLALSASSAISPSIAWAQQAIQQKIVFISPQGSDTVASGSQAQTFRTLTAAIAANPQEGSIFQLDAGTYSETSGESFPILLPKGSILRGNPANNGTNVTISGGGRFVSPTFASQNIAIVAANDSRIEGITIANSNPRGYGLWLESSRNVFVTNNNFVRNTHDGIFLTGNANAYIGDNLFTGNTGSGISALGTSTGEIRNNRFENTGFGLSIGQQSQVVLIGNNISRNVDGIVISNTAQPTLRGNAIADNQRNGLVVLSSANGSPRPDLGTTSSLGNNIFRNNREFDINNATTIPLAAFGNQINRSRVSGLLDLNASRSPIANPIVTATSIPSLPSIPASNIPANTSSGLPVSPAPAPNAISIPIDSQSIPKPATVFVPAKPPSSSQPLPNPVVSNNSSSNKNDSPMVITIERDYNSAANPTNPRGSNQLAALPPVTLDPTTGKPFQYRVIVPMTSTSVTQKVKTIVPSAFRLSRSGKTMLQVGAYSDRPAANQLVQKLAQSGLSAEIIPFR
jgi:parallel beta-helix repeat protein